MNTPKRFRQLVASMGPGMAVLRCTACGAEAIGSAAVSDYTCTGCKNGRRAQAQAPAATQAQAGRRAPAPARKKAITVALYSAGPRCPQGAECTASAPCAVHAPRVQELLAAKGYTL